MGIMLLSCIKIHGVEYSKTRKVLVIHPFTESIAMQYEKRQYIHSNKNVLPEFRSLHLIKAVQSIAGNECGFSNWFEALETMKQKMGKRRF